MSEWIAIFRAEPAHGPLTWRASVSLRWVLAVGIFVAVMGWWLARGPGASAFGHALLAYGHLAAPAWVLGLCFVVSRAILFSQACAHAKISISLPHSLRVFIEGVAIESISWPGKAWADVYRAMHMGQSPMTQRIHALVMFRLGGGLGGVAIGLLAGLLSLRSEVAGFLPWLALIVFIFALGYQWRKYQSHWSRCAAQLMGPGMLATTCDVAAITLLAHQICGAPAAWFACAYAMASIVAAVTMLPLGLGVLDLSCWHLLTAGVGADPAQAASVILLYRMTGPLFTAFMGVISLLARCLGERHVSSAVIPTMSRHSHSSFPMSMKSGADHVPASS